MVEKKPHVTCIYVLNSFDENIKQRNTTT